MSCNMPMGKLLLMTIAAEMRNLAMQHKLLRRACTLNSTKNCQVCRLVLKAFASREPTFLCQLGLYVSFIRPRLEYASPLWSPTGVAIRDLLERVQRIFMKGMESCFSLSYNARLAKLSLDTLAHRRLYHKICCLRTRPCTVIYHQHQPTLVLSFHTH